MNRVESAISALRRGELVIYPTETVYGLGADALDARAVEAVFEAKGRSREKPISMAVPGVETVVEYTRPTERERAFMEAFFPGPVTVVLERRPAVPDVLTAGSDRVGIRVPDDEVARSILESVAPITATSANVSGEPSVRDPNALDATLRDAVTVIVEDGPRPGGGSTVVDLSADEIIRRGHRGEEIEAWLDDSGGE